MDHTIQGLIVHSSRGLLLHHLLPGLYILGLWFPGLSTTEQNRDMQGHAVHAPGKPGTR